MFSFTEKVKTRDMRVLPIKLLFADDYSRSQYLIIDDFDNFGLPTCITIENCLFIFLQTWQNWVSSKKWKQVLWNVRRNSLGTSTGT